MTPKKRGASRRLGDRGRKGKNEDSTVLFSTVRPAHRSGKRKKKKGSMSGSSPSRGVGVGYNRGTFRRSLSPKTRRRGIKGEEGGKEDSTAKFLKKKKRKKGRMARAMIYLPYRRQRIAKRGKKRGSGRFPKSWKEKRRRVIHAPFPSTAARLRGGEEKGKMPAPARGGEVGDPFLLCRRGKRREKTRGAREEVVPFGRVEEILLSGPKKRRETFLLRRSERRGKASSYTLVRAPREKKEKECVREKKKRAREAFPHCCTA